MNSGLIVSACNDAKTCPNGADMFKRLLDILLSAMTLVVLSPVIGLLAWRIRHDMGSPVLFRQNRPGKDGTPFEMLKFRTMRDAYGEVESTLSDEDRLTQLGQMLRSSSLDELPELWNVLKGDMSLVGPRPLLMEYLPLYTAEQARRHEVRPGVTGWAQVNGRNAISWDEKFKLDLWYVENRSLWLDFKIMLMTILKVVQRNGISAEGSATMHKFTGSK